jgi:hypothetical protein
MDINLKVKLEASELMAALLMITNFLKTPQETGATGQLMQGF